jgi:hypothetical protein
MTDEYVDLMVRVPVEVVRDFQNNHALSANGHRRASTAVIGYLSIYHLAAAAALEFDLPPERVPVTPETPWGTVITQGESPSARRFLAPVDANRFVYDGSGLGCPHHGWYTHGWYEVERP